IHRPPPTPPHLPYTTLFRSQRSICATPKVSTMSPNRCKLCPRAEQQRRDPGAADRTLDGFATHREHNEAEQAIKCIASEPQKRRSEEHTSELQSPCNLVCRL